MEYVALESPYPEYAQVIYAHGPDECVGRTCVIHRRSDHHMRAWHQHFRPDRALMERICPHGVGHPDPDHMAFIELTRSEEDAWAEGVHGCDGCCVIKVEENE